MARTASSFGIAAVLVFFVAVKTTHKEKLLPVGSAAPVIHATTLDGAPVTVDFQTGPTVLWVVDGADRTGALDGTRIAELFRAKGTEYRFVGLALDGKEIALLARRAAGVPIYIASDTTVADYGSWHTATMVIARGGTVEHKWVGFIENSQADVERVFRMTFSRPH